MRQSYPRGTKDAIPILFGRPMDDQPQAEQWFGVHPSDDSPTPDGSTLSEYLVQDLSRLGRTFVTTFRHWLSFLMKALPTVSPPSLQTHPARQQVHDDHTHEPLMGISLGTPKRSPEGDWSKPETIVALTPLGTLVGFCGPLFTAQLLEASEVGGALASMIGSLRDCTGSPVLQGVFPDTLGLDDRHHLVDEVLGVVVNRLNTPGELGIFTRTAMGIDEHLPPDPGILTALPLSRFSLEPDQALAPPPGMIHNYLCDTCIEVMASSDSVLRGGLTGKHIDIDVFLHIVGFTPDPGDVLFPSGSNGAYIYPTSLKEFELWPLQPTDRDTLQALREDLNRICLVASGSFGLTGDGSPVVLKLGHVAPVIAEEAVVARGEGQLFVAATDV